MQILGNKVNNYLFKKVSDADAIVSHEFTVGRCVPCIYPQLTYNVQTNIENMHNN